MVTQTNNKDTQVGRTQAVWYATVEKVVRTASAAARVISTTIPGRYYSKAPCSTALFVSPFFDTFIAAKSIRQGLQYSTINTCLCRLVKITFPPLIATYSMHTIILFEQCVHSPYPPVLSRAFHFTVGDFERITGNSTAEFRTVHTYPKTNIFRGNSATFRERVVLFFFSSEATPGS